MTMIIPLFKTMHLKKYNNAMKKMSQRSYTVFSIFFLSFILLGSCKQNEISNQAESTIPHYRGESTALSINLQATPEYGVSENSATSTVTNKKLIAEWIKVNTLNTTRTNEKSNNLDIAAIELYENVVSKTSQIRNTRSSGYYFRIIAFRKTGNNYVCQSVADYVSNGTTAPELKRGEMLLPKGLTYRFVGFSFNNIMEISVPPTDYIWNNTSIDIPDLTNDFMTYDSGDILVSGEAFTLPVGFKQQLCKLTVKISATEFNSNTFTNCTGVQVKQGGNQSAWVIGSNSLVSNTNDTSPFYIPDNGSATTYLVPFDSPRPVSVYFGTLEVGGKDANNTTITSSQSVQLKPGKSYTMTVQLKKGIGITLSTTSINLGGTDCGTSDKDLLSKLTWAEGNLKSTGTTSSEDYIWGTPTEFGYYYTWMSLYTGNTTVQGNQDPCFQLDKMVYGVGWRTPSRTEFESLVRCTDKVMVINNGTLGMWFMNKTKGLFLPAAGFRYYTIGSGTTATHGGNVRGNYWSSGANGDALYFTPDPHVNTGYKTDGYSVRCVKTKE